MPSTACYALVCNGMLNGFQCGPCPTEPFMASAFELCGFARGALKGGIVLAEPLKADVGPRLTRAAKGEL